MGTIFRVGSKIEGVERQKYKTEVGRDAYYYSPESVRKIEEKYNERAPEGYESAKDLAARLGVHLQTVFRIASELEGVKEKKFKNDNNKDASYYSPEDVRKIEEKYNESAPEGYESARDLAERLGTTRTTLFNIADGLTSIERKKFRTESGIEAYYYSPESVRKIEEKYNERAPEGYESARDLAERLGTTLGTILKTARRMTDVEEKKHKTQNGKEAIHYTIDDAKKIEYELGEIAPNNYKNADDLAILFGVASTTITKKAKEGKIDGTTYRTMKGVKAVHYSLEEQNEIAEIVEQSTCNSSFPENAIAFYFEQSGIDIEQNIRPDWLKNPSTGRNLEIDIFISSLGIGLEYDGWRYHQNIERDIKKDFLMQREGYRVVHIREDGCPDLPEESDCIKRQKNNNDADLARCIKKCFEIIGLPTPDIDVARDKKDIRAFMRQRVLDKLDSARTFEELSVVS